MNQELQRAVTCRDLEGVQSLLSRGVDANLQVLDNDRGTLLHHASSVEITKELLLHGAQVDATNRSRDTPLHSAIIQSKGLEVVRELLKHGAYVNAVNRKWNTPLNHAVKKRMLNLDIVGELLEHGADINIRNRECRAFEDHNSSLENAVCNLECAKLLIKIPLLNNFDKDYRKIIDLAPYKDHYNYSPLSHYFEDCVCEVSQMKSDKIYDNVSLYEFMITNNTSTEGLYTYNDGVKNITDHVFVILNNTKYHVYHDMISSKIKMGLNDVERKTLLTKLSELQVYTESDASNQDVKEKRVILDSYSTYALTKYLSIRDLLNLIIAFYSHPNQSLGCSNNVLELKQPPKRHCEDSTGSCSKHARLEFPC